MHIEFRHLRTIRAIHQAGGLARGGRHAQHHAIGAQPSDQGARGPGRGRALRAPSKPVAAVGGGAAILAAGRAGPARDRGAGAGIRGAARGQRGAAAHGDRVPCLFRMAVSRARAVSQGMGEVDVDIRPGLAFDALPALQKEEVDLVVSSDPEDLDGVSFKPLFDYEPVFVASAQHPLGGEGVRGGRGFPRRDAHHLPGGPRAARRLHRAC